MSQSDQNHNNPVDNSMSEQEVDQSTEVAMPNFDKELSPRNSEGPTGAHLRNRINSLMVSNSA